MNVANFPIAPRTLAARGLLASFFLLFFLFAAVGQSRADAVPVTGTGSVDAGDSIGSCSASTYGRGYDGVFGAGLVDRTRPICVYPQLAAYLGSGSIDEAANFVCKAP
jgi:hypothetical protein